MNNNQPQPKRTLSRRQFLQNSATLAMGILAVRLPHRSLLTNMPATPTYSEAPMLADLVAQGKLPPVAERLPTTPGVIPVLESVGNYGDVIRRAHKGPSDRFGLTKMIDHGLVWFDQNLGLRAHIAESWQVNANATEWTFTLRTGMKWSDEETFTTADIQWWYEHVLTNSELTPNVPGQFTTGSNGTLMQLEVVDAQTVIFRFADSYPLFVYRIARSDNIIYVPSHYLAHFHVDTTADKTALTTEAQQAGFDNWIDYFYDRNTWYLNPAKPTLSPWLPKAALTESTFVIERNPYFFGVDSDGQQLPYVDQVVHEYVALDRLLDQWVINGNIDFQARHIGFSKSDYYQQHATEGDYQVVKGESAGHLALQLNLTATASTSTHQTRLRSLFQDQNVRHALSLAVDRAAINQQLYDGTATPRQYSPLPQSPQFHAALSNAYINYAVAQANTLLDQASYDKKDAEGFRLWSDGSGERIHFTIQGTAETGSVEESALQMVLQNFASVGIDATYQQLDRSTYEANVSSNQVEAAWWGGDRTVLPLLSPGIFLGIQFDRPWAVAWGVWRNNPNDSLAEEPPQAHWIRDIWALWDQIAVTVDESEQTGLFKQLLDIWARELPMIGYLGELPAPVIMKTGLRNYVAGHPIDDTTADEHLLNPETFFWEAPEPMVNLNYPTGQPGSFVTMKATNFPANQNATISVNDFAIGTTETDALGAAEEILDTSELPEGDYVVKLSVNPEAKAPLILSNDQPLRAKSGEQTPIIIPEEVTYQRVFLPLVGR